MATGGRGAARPHVGGLHTPYGGLLMTERRPTKGALHRVRSKTPETHALYVVNRQLLRFNRQLLRFYRQKPLTF